MNCILNLKRSCFFFYYCPKVYFENWIKQKKCWWLNILNRVTRLKKWITKPIWKMRRRYNKCFITAMLYVCGLCIEGSYTALHFSAGLFIIVRIYQRSGILLAVHSFGFENIKLRQWIDTSIIRKGSTVYEIYATQVQNANGTWQSRVNKQNLGNQ